MARYNLALSLFLGLALALVASVTVRADSTKFVGGYILMSAIKNGQHVGVAELEKLANKASTLPVSRIFVGFFDPTMVYVEVYKNNQHRLVFQPILSSNSINTFPNANSQNLIVKILC